MTIIVNQAIYGDKSGAYSLLKSSFEEVDIAKRICNATDLLDRPAKNVLEHPIVRGFSFNDYYVLVKSFPDLDSSVRTGRVFSHALIIHQEDLYKLTDIEHLFSFFLDEVKKDALLNPIEINNFSNEKLIEKPLKQRIYAGVNGLIKHQSFGNTILWKGEKDYIHFISHVWKNIPPSLRVNLTLGGVFNPKNIDQNKINILYSADVIDHKWDKVKFKIIDIDSAEELDSLGAHYLCGNYDKAKALVKVIETFKVQVVNFEDFSYLEIMANNYCALSCESKLNRLIILSDLLSKYSPKANIAFDEKKSVLHAVLNKMANASGKEIIALQYVDWKGFKGAEKKIKAEIQRWLTLSLSNIKSEQCAAEVISLALNDDNPPSWWTSAIKEFLHDLFNNWRTKYAPVLIEWVQFDAQFLGNLSQYIPLSENIENDIVFAFNKQPKIAATSFEKFSAERNWFKLYAVCVAQLYSLENAIKMLLAIDKSEDSLLALQLISDKANSKSFLSVAIKIKEPRLIQLAAEHVTQNRKLLSSFDVNVSSWIIIWLTSNLSCANVWQGINKPQIVLFKLLESHVKKQDIDDQLLLSISESSCNDLSLFIHRKEVWRYLEPVTRNNFLVTTTIACVQLLSQHDIYLAELEPEVVGCLASTNVIVSVINNISISLQVKLNLINTLQSLKESDLISLLEHKFSSSEALMLGDIIMQRKWVLLAKKIADKVNNDNRYDLASIKQQTKPLVSSWTDSFFSIFNGEGVAVSKLEDIKFKVALSFPGEKRAYVENVASRLTESLGKDLVFYDNNYISAISRPNADVLLQNVYRNQSELIVVFLCEEYSKKEWCGLEFRAVRDIIKAKEDDKIMFVRFDNAQIEGIFSIDGYIDGNVHNEAKVSNFILERLSVLS